MAGEQVSGGLRTQFFVMAVIVAGLVVLAELGLSLLLPGGGSVSPGVAADLGVPGDDFAAATIGDAAPPGAGIGMLALLDGLLLFTVLMLGLSLLLSQRLYGRMQGVVTLVFTLLWVLGGLLLALLAFAKLMLMVGLFVAVPFGTIAYLALWGFFPTGDAAVILSLILLLKIVFVVLLVLSQPRFLRIRGLVVLIALSVLLGLILGLIHDFLPGPVVAIGDQLWALVTAIIAIVWALIMLIGSIPAIVKAIRVSGAASD